MVKIYRFERTTNKFGNIKPRFIFFRDCASTIIILRIKYIGLGSVLYVYCAIDRIAIKEFPPFELFRFVFYFEIEIRANNCTRICVVVLTKFNRWVDNLFTYGYFHS